MKRFLLLSCIAVGSLLISCSDSKNEAPGTDKKITTEENKEDRNTKIIKASMEGFNAHDVGVMMKDASPDFVDYGDGSMQPMKNSDSSRAMMKEWFASTPDMKISDAEYFASGDKVVVFTSETGTWTKDIMGMKASGKAYKYKDAHIFTLNDKGQITEHHTIQSQGPVMASIGMHMPVQMEKK